MMTGEWIHLIESFATASVFSLIAAGMAYSLARLLAYQWPWIDAWRGFWVVVLLTSAATIFYHFIPATNEFIGVVQLPSIDWIQVADSSDFESQKDDIEDLTQVSFFTITLTLWFGLCVIGALYNSVILAYKLIHLHRLVRQSKSIAAISSQFGNCSIPLLRRLEKRYALTIRISNMTISPFIFQGSTNYLILSEYALEKLSRDELRLVIQHELTHLKRQDGRLVLFFQWCVGLFWFNPFLRLMYQQLQWAIESSCDRSVLSRQSNLRRIYAQAMLKILRKSATSDANQVVAAFSSKSLRRITMRIQHIMSPSPVRIKRSTQKISLLAFCLGFSSLAMSIYPAAHESSNSESLTMIHPVKKARLSSNYGDNNRFHKFHRGVDLAASLDTPVVAAASGRVVTSTEHLEGFKNYGTIIIIDHGNGVQSLYSHLNVLNVKEGDQVEQGQLIGRVGETGRATGPHVHFEILKDGKRVDPNQYYPFKS
ncbi:M23/M56 family metallopeptidase [Pleionea sediminis]|uniref:M23/M56 family metallopeptidase n=1 Tax=Pleionea sediminis TaxID=2569479 RepID=UPI0011850F7B|nr:M23/M56 family metallopeptidase [Pleionea sediminis]